MTASTAPGPRPTPQSSAPGDAAAASVPSKNGKHAAEPSVGQLVSDATTHLSNLVHSEIELAKLELRSTMKNGLAGAGAFIAAGVLLVFALIYGFFGAAEGIATALPRWASFLIVFGALVAVAALLVLFGIKKVKRIKAPQTTIRTTRETVDYLKKSRG